MRIEYTFTVIIFASNIVFTLYFVCFDWIWEETVSALHDVNLNPSHFSFIDHVHENILDSFISATACLRSWSPSCFQSTGHATRHNRRRPFFLKTFLPLALNATSLKEAAVALNKVSWWQALFLKGSPRQTSFVVFSLNTFANTFWRVQANLIYSENKCPESLFRGGGYNANLALRSWPQASCDSS